METFKEKMLQIINEDLEALYFEMQELDRQYAEKQKKVRNLERRKHEIMNHEFEDY